MILAVLLFWIYLFLFDADICSTMAFSPLGNSDHVIVSVSIDFPSNSKRDALIHSIAYDYSRADWDSLCDHLRDFPWKDIFNFGASAAANEFLSGFRLKLMYIYPSSKVPGQASLIYMGFSCLYCRHSL